MTVSWCTDGPLHADIQWQLCWHLSRVKSVLFSPISMHAKQAIYSAAAFYILKFTLTVPLQTIYLRKYRTHLTKFVDWWTYVSRWTI